jgi:hypothetical protein
MDENRKNAYRYLLYRAMLDIRGDQGQLYSEVQKINPETLKKAVQSVTYRTWCLAEWLHNLAFFACNDFRRFDEDLFWNDSETCCREFPEIHEQFKNSFEGYLEKIEKEGAN